MPKYATQLSDRAVAAIKRPGRHAVGGVPGLHLRVSGTHRGWVLRVTMGDKRRDLGLGPYPAVSLAEARAKARDVHDSLLRGDMPQSLATQRRQAIRAKTTEKSFDWCVDQYIAAKSHEWRNPKHRQQWINTLAQYAHGIIGEMNVADVQLPHIMTILTQPQADHDGRSLWESKTETASRLRGRIERVLDWATVSGYRSGDNPARWRGHLDTLLAAPRKVSKPAHHRALPFAEMPAFMRALRKRTGVSARALEFVILTAARSGEVRGAKWDELDFGGKVWTVPAERMKANKIHRVPLSDAATQLLQRMPRIGDSGVVFPGSKGQPLSDMSLSAVIRRMQVDCVPHGFRSTFREWAADRRYPREIAELCLAHTSVKGRVEAAYWRDDALTERAEIMQAWDRFCAEAAT